MYDKSVEYISGGSNVPDIREYFWKWRRHHNPQTQSNLEQWFDQLLKKGEQGMGNVGAFGHMTIANSVDSITLGSAMDEDGGTMMMKSAGASRQRMAAAPMAEMAIEADFAESAPGAEMESRMDANIGIAGNADSETVEPTVRSNFADTAYWTAALQTNLNGEATISLDMPENLTTWKVRSWAMGHGTKVGAGETEIITSKNVIIRLQAPRFFVEKDEVVLSAVVHNYLNSAKDAKVVLELDGEVVPQGSELPQRVDMHDRGRGAWLG